MRVWIVEKPNFEGERFSIKNYSYLDVLISVTLRTQV